MDHEALGDPRAVTTGSQNAVENRGVGAADLSSSSLACQIRATISSDDGVESVRAAQLEHAFALVGATIVDQNSQKPAEVWD